MIKLAGSVIGEIQTYTGKYVTPLDPSPDQIDIADIAHALSNLCRFGGHTREFYSVAQHSVSVSLVCDPKDALWGLLHDASEAYLVDIPRPIKRSPDFYEFYREAEARLMGAVCEAFGLAPEMPNSVHLADDAMLAAEQECLMPGGNTKLCYIRPTTPPRSEQNFLKQFNILYEKRAVG